MRLFGKPNFKNGDKFDYYGENKASNWKTIRIYTWKCWACYHIQELLMLGTLLLWVGLRVFLVQKIYPEVSVHSWVLHNFSFMT